MVKNDTYVVNTQFHEPSKNPKPGLLALQKQSLDQLLRFILWKFLASMG